MNSRNNVGVAITGGPASGEIKLDLSQVPVNPSAATTEIAECATRIQLNGTSIQTELATVAASALNDLRTRAVNLSKQQPDYITGIKCYYAVANNLLTLIYKPLYMLLQSVSGDTGTFSVVEGDFYSYNSQTSSFDKLEPADASGMIAAYREDVLICHQSGQQPSPFVPGTDPDAAIFPFQTVFQLLSDNESNSMVLHASIRTESGNSYKQCLLLSSKTTSGVGTGLFKAKFANRSHLCPPSCNPLTYTIVKN